MAKVRRVQQLELENFGIVTAAAEEAEGGGLLSPADVLAGEMAARQSLVATGKIKKEDEIPSWAEKYHELMNAGVRGRVAAYVAWATMPKKYRWPETQDDLAKKVLGLTSDRAIATWRKRFPEIDMMISDLQAESMLEYRPGAFHALGTVASDPSYRANQDRKLFFEMTRDFTPRLRTEEADTRVVGQKILDKLRKKSTAELIEMLGEEASDIMNELEEEFGEEEILRSAQNDKTGEDK